MTGAPVIEVRSLRKTRSLGPRSVEILHGIELAIPAGQYLAIVGASGSGKTTLLEVLGAMSQPSSGSYLFDGRAIADWTDSQLSALRGTQFGFVFQSFNLMPRMSALRNVALPLAYRGVGRREREERAAALLAQVGLADKQEQRSAELSGGERQRVAIARALANRPRVILADEPTGNLDSKTESEILDLFASLHAEGITLIVVTHSPAVALRSERTVELCDGHIVSDSLDG